MSERNPRNEKYSWMITGVRSDNPDELVKFYTTGLPFTVQVQLRNDDGIPVHTGLDYNGMSLMIEHTSSEGAPTPKQSGNGCPMSLYIYVENVDEAYKTALSAGAQSVMEPADMFWGDRMCTIVDPEGYQWSLGQNIADFDPENAPEGVNM